MGKPGYQTAEQFQFLKELKKHNQRDWFLQNKTRYEAEVRDPFLRLIAGLRPGLQGISPHFVVDSSPIGGSMTRIYRDIRFSKDKTPYKTSLAAHFWHAHGTEGMTPAFYLHLEPGRSSAGGGLWRPPPEGLRKIREAIVGRSDEWGKAVAGRSFRMGCGMAGESLKRPPPGFDADHPYIDDLKRKDFAVSLALSDKDLVRSDPLLNILGAFRAIAPFLRFIRETLGLPF